MAATTDIRYARVEAEYQATRQAQDQVFDKVDTFEAALLGLTEAVARNTEQIAEISQKLDAIIEHLQIPYDKPQMGFQKD